MQPEILSFVGCTIAARNYLAQANVLARSFRQHHPDSRFVILIVDQLEVSETRQDGVELMGLNEIGLAPGDSHRMPLIYDVTELSTAVKPWLLQRLRLSGPQVVIYFDPDIEIFTPLHDVGELARKHSIVLTPHVTEPLPRDGRQLGESDILSSGIYNLGFIAVGPGCDEFLTWWASRLRRECVIDPTRMRFTDQRWIDFVPGLFPNFILRDPTCNVAYWNLHSRHLTWQTDHYEVNGEPLRFFHFSGYDPEDSHLLSKHQGNRPRILFSEHPDVARICYAYRDQLVAGNFGEKKRAGYGFDYLPSGLKIDRHIRRAYREALIEFEEGGAPIEPPDPFARAGEQHFIDWLNEPMNTGFPVVTRYMLIVHSSRADLQASFPQPLGSHAAAFHVWFASQGRLEEKVAEVLVPSKTPDPSRVRDSSSLVQDHALGNTAMPGNSRVTVAGYFRAELGVGEAARLLIAGLEASETPFQIKNYSDTVSRQDHPFKVISTPSEPSDINIVCINADQTPFFAAKASKEFFLDRHTIGLWFWEVEEFPASLHQAFNYVNEIWVVSDFMREALLKVSPHPVFKFPLPVVKPQLDCSLNRRKLGWPDRFSFLFLFDFMSVFERKNPLGLIEAFSRAFKPGEGPVLVIKTINGDKRLSDLEKLKLAAAKYPDIQIVDGYVSAAEKNFMMSACDCYVSLHRAEGYGLTLAEAMSLGRPVIATGYSGNCEFMTAENSYLCSYDLRPIGEGHAPYPAHARWAHPNLEEASVLLRRVAERPEEARRIGMRAADEILRAFAPVVAGEAIRQRLSRIRSSRLRVAQTRKGSIRHLHPIDSQLEELCGALDEVQENILSSTKKGAHSLPDARKTSQAPELIGTPHEANPALSLSLRAAREKAESVRALYRYLQKGTETLRAQFDKAEREVWEYKVKRADAAARARSTEGRLKKIEQSALWKIVKPLLKLYNRTEKSERRIGPEVVFQIEAPIKWKTDRSEVPIEGWCFLESGQELAGVRVKIQRQGRLARYGIERLDVWRTHGHSANARFCGFSISLPIPLGTSLLTLDAIVQGEEWTTFFEHEIIRFEPPETENVVLVQRAPALDLGGRTNQTMPSSDRIDCTALESNQQPGD